MQTDTDRPGLHPRAAITLSGVQLLFTLAWTMYLVFLPKLFQQAGLPATLLLPLLMIDQAIFAVASRFS